MSTSSLLFTPDQLISLVSQGAHQALRFRGYQWEVQQRGETKLGLWRKNFRNSSLREPVPRRLVFLPGFGDTPLSWLPVLSSLEPVLRSRFDEVILVDFPGYNGMLSGEPILSSIDDLIEVLFDALDALKPHTIIGHSLGGFLTAQYTAACSTGRRHHGRSNGHRELVSAIVINPSGLLETDDDQREWADKMERLSREGVAFWRPFVFAREPLWFRPFAEKFLNFITRKEAIALIRSFGPSHNLKHALPQITVPMTVIWGEKDTLLPAAQLMQSWLKKLQSSSSSVTGILLRNVGHSPHVEAIVVTVALLGQVLLGKEPHPLARRWYHRVETTEASESSRQP